MDSALAPEKLRKKQTRLIMDLVKGKQYANQLQALLHKPFANHEGLVLAEELAQKVLKSFTDSLAEISSCRSSEKCQIAAADQVFSAYSGDLSFQDFDDSKKRTEVKDRRGGYKRRRAAESWVIVSPTVGDGYAWRKYGQKEILNSKYPRCYFRCTHKYDQGCRAFKQVQKIDQETIVYQTTYFGHHTCRDTMKTSQIISDSDPMESNFISFQGKVPRKQYVPPRNIIPSVKQESKEETQSDLTDNKSSINSTMWQDLVATGSSVPVMELSPKMGSYHEEVVSSAYTSAASINLHGLDIKAFSKFADFNNHDFLLEDNEFL